MSLKQELEIWAAALQAYDDHDYPRSLSIFNRIADTSKVFFNMAIIQATIGRHELALRAFSHAIRLDEYLSIAYFQSGVSNFILKRYTQARIDFDDALVVRVLRVVIAAQPRTYMRSNEIIDYEQIGLDFRLYACEILFNRGLSAIRNGQYDLGMRDLEEAAKRKQESQHFVIEDAISDQAEGCTIFSIPIGLVFRPSPNKLRNLETKNYLGQARLVAATSAADAFTGFSGTTKREQKVKEGLERSRDVATPQSLSRAKTRAAKLQRSDFIDGLAPSLRRSPLANTTISEDPKGVGLVSVQPVMGEGDDDLSAVIAFMTLETKDPQSSLITPPASEVGTGSPQGLSRSTTLSQQFRPKNMNNLPQSDYTGFTVIESYLNDEAGAEKVGSAEQTTPLRTGREVGDAPAVRVAHWAKNQSTREVGRIKPLERQASASRPRVMGVGLTRQGIPNDLVRGANNSRTSLQRQPSSGAWFDGSTEMSKVRVKLTYENDTRAMSIKPEVTLQQFQERVKYKFQARNVPSMKYKDVEGGLISIVDEDDWETAMDSACEVTAGRAEGKLEIQLS
ncbi:BQ2448_847 [Microbotryum intermedium]|uniref:BQ2448_847 protein n=1 Tax=Microbotryum intermedium TaxID=269621 RepID=A0A238FCB5_9BASI|nr:BQ2448_847 [Microbotryum intermedium]